MGPLGRLFGGRQVLVEHRLDVAVVVRELEDIELFGLEIAELGDQRRDEDEPRAQLGKLGLGNARLFHPWPNMDEAFP